MFKYPCLLAAFLFPAPFLFAQAPVALPPAGGGARMFETGECLPPEKRAAIAAKLEANVRQLQAAGKLPAADDRSTASFDWPLRQVSGLDWNSTYILVNFVDHEPSGGLLEYECGARTYNGHQGIDITLWPFPWHLKTNDLVEVVAAEAGMIIAKDDGHFDEYCSWGNNQDWNAVYIRHADGSVAWYGHMKKFSLTGKPPGATVEKGEYLGIVASSGYSTAPHLHFEVYKQTPYEPANLIDPYAGECNPGVPASWWADQQPYWKPTVNAVLTHDAVPEHGGCPAQESAGFADSFEPGSTIYTAFYYRDQQFGQVSTMRLRKPDGSVWNAWTHASPDTYSGSWWYWSWNLPAGGPFGSWTQEVVFNGESFSHTFFYGNAVSTDIAAAPAAIFVSQDFPAGSFTLHSAEDGDLWLEVFDCVGRRRHAGREQLNRQIRLEGAEAGVYVLKAKRNDRVQLFRIVLE